MINMRNSDTLRFTQDVMGSLGFTGISRAHAVLILSEFKFSTIEYLTEIGLDDRSRELIVNELESNAEYYQSVYRREVSFERVLDGIAIPKETKEAITKTIPAHLRNILNNINMGYETMPEMSISDHNAHVQAIEMMSRCSGIPEHMFAINRKSIVKVPDTDCDSDIVGDVPRESIDDMPTSTGIPYHKPATNNIEGVLKNIQDNEK